MTDDTLYRIRPLEWTDCDSLSFAKCPVLGEIIVAKKKFEGSKKWVSLMGLSSVYQTREEAKQIAIEWRIGRLTQCLIPHTPEENNE